MSEPRVQRQEAVNERLRLVNLFELSKQIFVFFDIFIQELEHPRVMASEACNQLIDYCKNTKVKFNLKLKVLF